MSGECFPTVFALSGTIPGEPGVGGVILEDLQRLAPSGRLSFFSLPTRHAVDLRWPDRGPCSLEFMVRRYEPAWRPVGGFSGNVVSYLARRITFATYCRRLVDQICNSPSARRSEVVWAVLDCPSVIEIAVAVARRLRKPLVSLVWDAPELLADQLMLDGWSMQSMLARFEEVLRTSERVAVICEQMKHRYQSSYGISRPIILRHGIQKDLRRKNCAQRDRFVIGFAGSVTAAQPFQCLIQALDHQNWVINGKPVTLRLIGARHMLDSRKAQHIEYFGWRSLQETVEILAECRIAYLPQPFEPRLRILAELSFPTKLSTYLAASCRMLIHTPDYGSLHSLVHQYPIGVVCDELRPDRIAESLLLLDRMPDEAVEQSISVAVHDEFNSDVFRSRFLQLVGANVSEISAQASTANTEHN